MRVGQIRKMKIFNAAVKKSHARRRNSTFIVKNAGIIDDDIAFFNGIRMPSDANKSHAVANVLNFEKIRMRMSSGRNDGFIEVGATNIK